MSSSSRPVPRPECPLDPIGNDLVLKPVDPEERTKGGIYLPDSAKEQQCLGDVLAVGPRCDPMNEIKVGQRLGFQNVSAMPFTVNGVEYWVISEDDVRVRVRLVVPDGV